MVSVHNNSFQSAQLFLDFQKKSITANLAIIQLVYNFKYSHLYCYCLSSELFFATDQCQLDMNNQALYVYDFTQNLNTV